ncbi:hypothetical protein ANCDUO_27138 [Ancylostoma duodenale]|uniref:Uncharacterized protein n=1 Tax=Ancylostoma duodenale TaxID=51022 RepID=A0A0C2FCW9_9BILA|nr:hypothetical protein ANCDUO_27138 [Ancylostoma duodenale]
MVRPGHWLAGFVYDVYSPEESAQFYAVSPPNTPVEEAPTELPATPTAVKIRGGAAYYSAHL